MPHARILQDWLEGWNGHDLDRIMCHYAADAVFVSPSVLALVPASDGTLRGREAIRAFYGEAFARFPALRFELEDVIERPYGAILLYRKQNVFAARPGLTVEVFEIDGGQIRRNVVYWSVEEIASRLGRGVSPASPAGRAP